MSCLVQQVLWTTDAIYRETKAKLEARKNEGCLAVEMELAGVQAVCDFYGWDLYDFLVTGDVLDQAVYDVIESSLERQENTCLPGLFTFFENGEKVIHRKNSCTRNYFRLYYYFRK